MLKAIVSYAASDCVAAKATVLIQTIAWLADGSEKKHFNVG